MGNNKYTDDSGRETADYVIAATKEGRTTAGVAKEIGLNDKTVNDWVMKRKRALGIEGTKPELATGEGREPREAKRRIHELETGNAFPRKDAAFFAEGQA